MNNHTEEKPEPIDFEKRAKKTPLQRIEGRKKAAEDLAKRTAGATPPATKPAPVTPSTPNK